VALSIHLACIDPLNCAVILYMCVQWQQVLHAVPSVKRHMCTCGATSTVAYGVGSLA
jgi:hypothetical protein